MRPENWEIALAAEIAAARERAWEWGAHDCASFAARCLEAEFGFAPPAWGRWAGRWTTERGALRVLASEGFDGLGAAVDAACRDARRASPRTAGRGDIAALPTGSAGFGGMALGVVEGAAVWIASAPRGLARARLADALAVWPAEGFA